VRDVPEARILIVEDEDAIMEIVSQALRRHGYETASASDGDAALEKVFSLRPDLVILDLMMEEKDTGFVLAHEIKRVYPDVPVVMMSAVTSATRLSFAPRTADERSWVKADLWLDKPANPEHLRVEVRRLLGIAAPAAAHH